MCGACVATQPLGKKLQEEMQNGNWQPSDYRIFEVREPKPRRINATDFRDRALSLKPTATLLAPVSEGVPFLGFRIFPQLLRLNRQSLRRFRRRLRRLEQAYQCGRISIESLTASGLTAKQARTV
ncbi:MAG: hypothetical protein ABFS56_12475 [Pseudomonadota bacterium]